MRMKIFILFSSLIALNVSANNTDCHTFLSNSKITFQVPFNPGGSYDLTARALAESFREITGKKVFIQNNPSLSGLISLNSVIRSTPKDIHLGFFSGRNLIELSNDNKITWDNLVTPTTTYLSEETIWLTRKVEPADILEVPEIIIGGSKNDDLEAKAIAKFLGKKSRLISGYSGSSEYAHATLRREVDFFGPARVTAERFIRTGEYSPSLIISHKSDSHYPALQNLNQARAKLKLANISNKKYVNIAKDITRISQSDRMIFTSKKLTAIQRECLNETVKQALHSKTFTEKASKLNLNTFYETPDEAHSRLIQINQSLKMVHDFTND